MKNIPLKRIVVWRVVGLVLVVVLLGSIFLLGDQVQGVRRGLLSKQLSLEDSLKTAVYQASLQDQLVEYESDVARVESMMPTQDEIGSVISSVEAEAKKFSVTVKVPKVQEELTYDENGDKVEQTGPIRSVRIQIQGQGDPIALINFMHTVEHLPYLLGTVSFVFDSDSSSAAGGPTVVGPGSGPPGAESLEAEPRRASLRMEIVLTIRATEGIN
jgi:Tfp pilus assembly protein PilO